MFPQPFFFTYIIKTGNENKYVLYLIKVTRSDLTGAKTSTYYYLAFVFYLEHKYRSLTSRSENKEFCAARFRDWDCAVCLSVCLSVCFRRLAKVMNKLD